MTILDEWLVRGDEETGAVRGYGAIKAAIEVFLREK